MFCIQLSFEVDSLDRVLGEVSVIVNDSLLHLWLRGPLLRRIGFTKIGLPSAWLGFSDMLLPF